MERLGRSRRGEGDQNHGGVVVSTNGGGSGDWLSDELPAGVAVTSLSFNGTSRQLAAATFSRGAYVLDLDDVAPSVQITYPHYGDTVSGTITVTATASDNHRVAGVQFKLDGANFGAEVTSPPYQVTCNTTTTLNGSHQLTAVARDPAGNTTTSAIVKVKVAN